VNDLPRGISVNADVIEGGTRSNVIAERARAVLDLRALRISDMRSIEKRLRSLRPVHRGAKLEIRGGFNRAPLEHKVTAALFVQAKSLAAQMGLSLGEATAGGAPTAISLARSAFPHSTASAPSATALTRGTSISWSERCPSAPHCWPHCWLSHKKWRPASCRRVFAP